MRFEEFVIRLRQPVEPGVDAHERSHRLNGLALPGQRDIGRRAPHGVAGPARDVLRHDPGARPGGQGDGVLQCLGGQLDGDVGRTVADADDQDAFAGQVQRVLRIDVVVGVDGLAGELAWEVGVSGVPVVAVADDEQIELAGRALLVGDVPPPVGPPRGVLHAVVELDVLQQAERVGVRVEIGLDVAVVREGRKVLRDRKVLERQPFLRGVDVQRAVRAGQAVGVAERPVAADAVGQLERGVRHPVVLEHLAGGKPADAGADDRRAGQVCGHG